MRVVGAVLGAFFLISVLTAVASWPGYQVARRSTAAERALAEGRHEKAIELLLPVVERFPKAWLRWNQLGDCYLETGQPLKAREAYERSLSVQPNQSLEARLGRVAEALGDPAEAARQFRAALEVNREDPYVNYYVGLYSLAQGDFVNAAEYFRAASADPRFFEKARPHLEAIRERLLGPEAS